VPEPKYSGLDLGIVLEIRHVGRLVELDDMIVPAIPGTNSKTCQRVRALADHQGVAEDLEALQEDVLAVRDHPLPSARARSDPPKET
jgi:hypothetical protein